MVPDKNKTIRCSDMGISVGKATLSQKVLDKLKDQPEKILDKLDPAILIGERFGLWPQDQEMINVRTLADYFTQLTHLPMLQGSLVLPDCLAKGVQRNLFAYALGDGEKKQFDTILFNDKTVTADGCDITESAWLLRPALAKSLLPEPKPVEIGTGAGGGTTTGTGTTGGAGGGTKVRDDEPWTGGGKPVIVKGERRLNRVRLDMKVPWEHWNDVYNEVIDPLVQEGAEVHCQVIVLAKGDAAIRENTVELGIKESLSQRGIQADVQTG